MFSLDFFGFCGLLVVKGSYTDLHRFDPRRPYSIKTRIKTESAQYIATNYRSLADHIPLKQGLRPQLRLLAIALACPSRRPYSIKTRIKTAIICPRNDKNRWLADHIPLKQGLRPLQDLGSISFARMLADHIPLKQGLRHTIDKVIILLILLADHIPLKQGLRLSITVACVVSCISRRQYSIKARIKTGGGGRVRLVRPVRLVRLIPADQGVT